MAVWEIFSTGHLYKFIRRTRDAAEWYSGILAMELECSGFKSDSDSCHCVLTLDKLLPLIVCEEASGKPPPASDPRLM